MAAPEISHGRGGAGNINPDDTKYVDGEVVRVGVEGSHNDGAFSTGRGGETVFPLFCSFDDTPALNLCCACRDAAAFLPSFWFPLLP